MLIIFIYTPALLCLPALLLVGVVFVVVPGGFIIVLGGLYYLLMGFIGVVGLASRTAWRARRSRSASGATGFVPARTPARETAFAPARIASATPAIAGLPNRAIGSAANGLLRSGQEHEPGCLGRGGARPRPARWSAVRLTPLAGLPVARSLAVPTCSGTRRSSGRVNWIRGHDRWGDKCGPLGSRSTSTTCSRPARCRRCRSRCTSRWCASGFRFPVMVLFVEWLLLAYGRSGSTGRSRGAGRGSWSTLFAVGVITGTMLSFEMGLLWPNFTGTFGGVFGLGFAIEGFSFFLEAIFIGIYVYGWDRLSPRAHLLTRDPDRDHRLHRLADGDLGQRVDEPSRRVPAARGEGRRRRTRSRRCSATRTCGTS